MSNNELFITAVMRNVQTQNQNM